MIQEDYVTPEIAKLLRQKGFKGDCIMDYIDNELMNVYDYDYPSMYELENTGDDVVDAPTLQMAMKWLREVHYLHITVHPGVSEYGFVWTYSIVFAKEAGKGETHFYKISQIATPIVKSKSYEQACEAAIKYCLENLL